MQDSELILSTPNPNGLVGKKCNYLNSQKLSVIICTQIGDTITKAFQDVAVALHRYKSSPTITYLNTTPKINPPPKYDTASLPRVEFPQKNTNIYVHTKKTSTKLLNTFTKTRLYIPTSTDKELKLQHQSLNHIFDTHGVRQNIDTLLRGDDSTIWKQAVQNELA